MSTLHEDRMNGQGPHLQHPPIIEVVCGVAFEPIRDLDPLALGIYWDQRSAEYPTKSLQVAFGTTSSREFTLLPVRAVFVEKDDQFVLQLQDDCFFVNWRKRGQRYPRFSGNEGVLQRTRTEFELFESFVSRRFGKRLLVRQIDMSKIDLLYRGIHWQDLKDLAALVPLAGVFNAIQEARSREFNLSFIEHGPIGDMTISMATAVQAKETIAVRIESRIQCDSTPERLWETFTSANSVLNKAFFSLLVPAELGRFEVEGQNVSI